MILFHFLYLSQNWLTLFVVKKHAVKGKTPVDIHDNEGVDEDVSEFVQLQDQRDQIRKKGILHMACL